MIIIVDRSFFVIAIAAFATFFCLTGVAIVELHLVSSDRDLCADEYASCVDAFGRCVDLIDPLALEDVAKGGAQ